MAGGKREGAGRPPLVDWFPLVKITVRLPKEYVDWALEEGNGRLAEGLRLLLEELDQRRGRDAGGQGPEGGARSAT